MADDAKAGAEKRPSKLSNVTILLVDDEIDLLDMTKTRLELEGAMVADAPDGLVALECLEKGKFDVVVTDIRMPRMDGKELVLKIREGDKNIPIICMSGFSDYTDEEILAWGANQSFRKPLPISDLIEKILILKNS